ncbi:stage III sporulation protein AG [Psychrobacillus insolitus]|uniref:Stage III sporulation protein AG n=1 Tax=Psychrobacillus insolitus TaxID=1461 RepID=A0A2W7MIZ1_9BACI|nr:hypothetical protein [Psychrobacillus insolitus]PZX07262.1 stage III sporulation protein AG [Psychrobacillus insolitus]
MAPKQIPTFRFVVIGGAVLFISLLLSGWFSVGSSGNTDSVEEVTQSPGELSEVLEKISGVGRVAVYFHYQNGTEETAESEVSFFQWTSDSKRDKEAVIGILVVAEGASDKRIQHKLVTTLSSVLQISPHRIVVEEMELEE